MARFSKKNFIQPGYEFSDQIRIRDKNNKVKLTIANNTGTTFFNKDNEIKIKTASENNTISLDFKSKTEALEALVLLKDAYSVVVKNYNDNKKAVIEPEVVEFNSDNGNISDGQSVFPVPEDISEVFVVTINGVIIETWDYDIANSVVEIDVDTLGYTIDSEDEVTIKYFI